MTFEEFFHKKKIDLVQLQQAESALFYEFKSHFTEMGEKSFDHSKKFWFNKLRRLYHIIEEPKAERTKIEINQIASQAEPLSSPVPESKTGFTPRFKAKPAVSEESNPLEENQSIKESEVESSAKPAFKPRFKPQLTQPEVKEEAKGEQAGLEENNQESQEATASKPTFKPRFKPQMAKPVSEVKPVKLEEDKKEENLEESKPIGFKPRFKAQITKSATEVPNQSDIKPVEIKEEQNAEEAAPKLGFKPRFKAGVTTPKTEIPENKEVTKSAENTSGEPTPKLGFKPRFKAGITKAPDTESLKTDESSIALEPAETSPNSDIKPQLEAQSKAEETSNADSPSTNSADISKEEKPATALPTKLGFKPRFKAPATKQDPPAGNPE